MTVNPPVVQPPSLWRRVFPTGPSVAVIAAALLFAVGCSAPTPVEGPTGDSDAQSTPAADWTPEVTAEPVPVVVGLPFVPNVQFAPFYVAVDRGFYEAEGLDVTFQYGDEAEFLRLVASHRMAATVASGEQVVLARAAELPLRYVMTWYHRFPVAVFSLENLQHPRDLADMTVGMPQPDGATATGYRAMLEASDVAPDAITVEYIGFVQADAVASGQVDAAVGYAVNEPLVLRRRGLNVGTLEVADYMNLVANGLVVAESTVNDSPELAEGLVMGTLRGIAATLEDPDAAFEVVLRTVEAADSSQDATDLQREVLEESLRFWQPPEDRSLGAIDRSAWETTRQFLIDQGIVSRPAPEVDAMIETRFVDAASLPAPESPVE